MPILLYFPREKGGPYRDSTLSVPGVTRIMLTEKVNEPYLPAVFDGRLILCSHGSRNRPLIMGDAGRWINAYEFVHKYKAHFEYLKAHVKRIDLFMCHTGHSGFGHSFTELMRHIIEGDSIHVNAPTAQLTIDENEKKWRVGVGAVLPYVIGLSRLFFLGEFDRYSNPFNNMMWAGYPKPRAGASLNRVWTALSGSLAHRNRASIGELFGFGFKHYTARPMTQSENHPARNSNERDNDPSAEPSTDGQSAKARAEAIKLQRF